MNAKGNFQNMDAGIPPNAVSIYQNETSDEFPILKAFQQYIDAEQAKARKRLISLGIFFGILMGAVIAVFVAMLMNISQRNQLLNDRLVEFAMKERDRQPVVVQQPSLQDNSAIISLTTKLEDMQRKLLDSQQKVKEVQDAAEKAANAAKGPSPEELEIQRLKTLLAMEKDKAAAKEAEEKRLKREAELEEYRRKHYPEFYATKPVPEKREAEHVDKPIRKLTKQEAQEILDEIGAKDDDTSNVLDDNKAISYFDDEANTPSKKISASTATSTNNTNSAESKKTQSNEPTRYTIPVDIKGSKSSWVLP